MSEAFSYQEFTQGGGGGGGEHVQTKIPRGR